ncbi:MAG: hemolysin family protein [Candidatus Acidiferrales bacterium]
MLALRIFGVLAIIAVNAFFSAAEFSLVAVRLSRVRQLLEAGDARAKIIEELLSDMGRVVSGVQVGITLTALALGYAGELTVAAALEPAIGWLPGRWAAIAAHGIALVLAFGLLTVFQVILGELVPKSISLARAERVALIIARPFRWFLRAFSPLISFLDSFASRMVRILGVTKVSAHTMVHSPEELLILIEQARERGLLQSGEEKFIQSVMELGQVQAREIMVPKPDMHVLPVDATFDEAMRLFATTQRSRIPVYEGSLDHIRGFVHIKDFIWVLLDGARRVEESLPPPPFELRRFLRDILIVPETKPASELLLEFRTRHAGIAMVVDEFGSILGLVTLEDILEEMVGEIHDEFDVVERPLRLGDGALVFDAALKIRDLATQYKIVLPEDPAYETLGGFVLSQLGFIPRGGESFEACGFRFTVLSVEGRRVSRVKIHKIETVSAAAVPESQRATETGSRK